MQVIQVDVVTLQAAQTGFDGVHNVIARCAAIIGAITHRPENFDCQYKLIPAAFERVTEGHFRLSAGVDISGIDKINPQIQSGIDHIIDSHLRNVFRAKAVGSQTNG